MKNNHQHEVFDYVKDHLDQGFSKDEIRIQLQNAGWNNNTIKSAFNSVNKINKLTKSGPAYSKFKRWDPSDFLIKHISTGLVSGLVTGVVLRAVLPTAQEQFAEQFNASYTGAWVPTYMPTMLFVLIILSVLYGFTLNYFIKSIEPYWTAFFVIFMGVFLDITILDRSTVGQAFVYLLPITCTISQLLCRFINSSKLFKPIFLALIIILFVISMRTLMEPRLPA